MHRIFTTSVFVFGMLLMFVMAMTSDPQFHPQWFVDLMVLVGVGCGFFAVASWGYQE